ncbi:MAG TPA: alpha/beta fold hydrolase [Anaerolineaceae bacterium]|nr:alpha/beta fold hydrolase [Anaerolineaceae bacterium]
MNINSFNLLKKIKQRISRPEPGFFQSLFIFSFLSLLISGCGVSPTDLPVMQDPTNIPITATIHTPSPSPTSSLTSTITPTSTTTPTATPTLHPMTILSMRQTTYPGSDIVVEATLTAGSNYDRYYAYYLSEGYKIYGLLTVPFGDPPEGGWPSIVFNHGYIPPTQYRTTERYIAYVDWLARSQYIVFRIDFRGHDQSEGTARGAYGDPGYTVDVLNAVSSLQKFPLANPEKIGMWGHSMGGYLTLRSMVISDDIKAGVIWAGVVASYTDMMALWRRNTPGPAPTAPSFARRWQQEWINEHGSSAENPDFWSSISSNTYVGEISGPVQLHQGTADESVPVVFSELLWKEILAANGEVEFFTYDGDNHNLSNYFSLAMTRSIEFFDRYLK